MVRVARLTVSACAAKVKKNKTRNTDGFMFFFEKEVFFRKMVSGREKTVKGKAASTLIKKIIFKNDKIF